MNLNNYCQDYGHTPWALWVGQKHRKIDYFLYFHTCWRKNKCILLMSKKPFNQIVKFMAPGSGVQILGLGQYVKKRLNLKIYSVLPYIFEKKTKCICL